MALNSTNRDENQKAYYWIRCMRNVAVPTIIVSIACIIIGVLAIAQSAPRYAFPFCLGGAMIAGVSTLLAAICNIQQYRKYINNGGQDPKDTPWSTTMIFVGTFMLIALVIGLGVSGIWGIVEAKNNIDLPNKSPSEEANEMAEYGQKNLGYAIATFVLVLILCILKVVANCACMCYYEAVVVYIDPYARDSNRTIDNEHDLPAERDQSNDVANVGSLTNITNTSHDIDSADQVISTYDRQIDDTNSLLNFISAVADHVVPSAPLQNDDTFSSEESLDTYNDDEIRSTSTPPPSYDEVVEPPPPSYRDVLEHGGFSVDRV